MNRNLALTGFAILTVCHVSLLASAQSTMQATSSDDVQTAVGYDQVRTVIRKRCVNCHNPDEMRGDLDLSGFDVLLAGGASGLIVVAGKPNQSLLYKSVAHLEDPVMPPNSPRIPGRELDLIRRWIEDGLTEKTGPRSVAQHAELAGSSAAPAESGSNASAAEIANPPLSVAVAPGLKPVRPLLRGTAIVALDNHPSKNIAAISGNQQAVLLDIDSGAWLGAFEFPEGDVTALRFSRDGRLLVVAGGVAGLSGRVVAFDVVSGERVFELADENDTILSVDLSPDGSLLALDGPTKVVRIFDVATGEVLHTLRKHTDWVLAVRFSPDGLLLASGDRFGGLFIWDVQSGDEFQTLRGHVGAVNALAWDVSSEVLLSGGEDERVRTWSMHYGKLTNEWTSEVGAILSLAISGPLVTCGGRDKKLSIWRGPDHRVASIEGTDQFERIAFSADQKSLVSGDAVGSVRMLDIDSLQVRSQVTLPVDDRQRQAVYDRLAEAEQLYAEKPILTQPPAPAASATESSQTALPDLLLALESQLESADAHLHAARQNVAALNQALAASDQAIEAADDAVQQLRAARVVLGNQISNQEAALAIAEKQLIELDRVYHSFLSSMELTSADSVALRKRMLSRLESQHGLLDTAMTLQEQVNSDPGLRRA